MRKPAKIIKQITEAASAWADPSNPQRKAVIEETLAAPNQWTEQALDHAFNRWMQGLTKEALTRWLGDVESYASVPSTIGVVHGEVGPFSGFRDAIAVWVLGFGYVGALPDSSPAILPGFAKAVFGSEEADEVAFASTESVFDRADAVIARPDDDDDSSLQAFCDTYDISPSQLLVRPPVYSVGIVDGHESEDEMERLAEDMLLYEGYGRRRLAIVWAPHEHPPDAYLEAMARFRGLFPAHEDTPGTLQMQQAFLEARDEPHGYAEGLEFLVSRGDPVQQRAGHIRWTEYREMNEVRDWIASHEDEVYAVIARRHIHDQLPDDWSLRAPGGVHIPPLDDTDGRALVTFLREIAEAA